jgi:predicted acylesterase/phospholipase RssA
MTTNGERQLTSGEPHKVLRIALAMRGGVSLAVWIGGAVAEIDLFRRACNGDDLGADPLGCREKRAAIYRERLANTGKYDGVRVDILAGASAGGLNAVLFGLAQSCNTVMDDIVRRTWIERGGIWELLREPGFGRAPSILRGDERLFTVARDALGEIAGGSAASSAGARRVDRVSVELAATLLDDAPDGKRSNRARFSFAKTPGDLRSCYSTIPSPDDNADAAGDSRAAWRTGMALDRMALAARATSSFPGAFEPASIYSVPSGAASPGATAPLPTDYLTARQTSVNMARAFVYSRAQGTLLKPFNVVDGGIFDNIPIDRAIRAIQRMPATQPSGRVLIYLDPEPPVTDQSGFPSDERDSAASWIPVIHRSFTLKERTETEDDELAQVREHNDRVMETRGRLEALAAVMRRLRRSAGDADAQVGAFVDELITDESYLQCRIAVDSPRIGRLLADPAAELCYPPRQAVDYVRLPPIEGVKIKNQVQEAYSDHPVDYWNLSTDVCAMLDWVRVLIGWVHALEDLVTYFSEAEPESRAVVLPSGVVGGDELLPPAARQSLTDGLQEWKPRLYRWLTVLIEARHRSVDEVLAWPLRSELPEAGKHYPLAHCLTESRGRQLGLRLTPEINELLIAGTGSDVEERFYTLLSAPDQFCNPGTALVEAVTEGLDDILGEIRTCCAPVVQNLTAMYEQLPDASKAPEWFASWCESVYPHFYTAPLQDYWVERLSRLFAVTGVPDTASIINYERISSKEPPRIDVSALKNAAKAKYLGEWMRRLPSKEQMLTVLARDDSRLEPDAKLAGNVLMRFGGFFLWRWRENDWQWGRLDAASGIVKILDGLARQRAGDGEVCAATADLQKIILKESASQERSAGQQDDERPLVETVGGDSFQAVSAHYRFALASRIVPLVARALWPAKGSALSLGGAAGRLANIAARPLTVPLPLIADPLRLAMALVVVLGSAFALGARIADTRWCNVVSAVLFVLGLTIAARAWKAGHNWRQLNQNLGELNTEHPLLGIETDWIAEVLTQPKRRKDRAYSWLLAVVVLAAAIALPIVGYRWHPPGTIESFIVAALGVVGAQHWLNKRSYRILPSAQDGDKNGRRVAVAILVGVGATALIFSPMLIGSLGHRYAGAAIVPLHWNCNHLPGDVIVAAVAAAALTAISLWGWARNFSAALCIAVSAAVGAVAQWGFDALPFTKDPGVWNLLPVWVWVIVLGIMNARLPHRTEKYGEPAKPKPPAPQGQPEAAAAVNPPSAEGTGGMDGNGSGPSPSGSATQRPGRERYRSTHAVIMAWAKARGVSSGR